MWTFKYWWRLNKEKAQMWIAWKLPKWLAKWAAVRVIAHATTAQHGPTSPGELTAIDALKRWDGAGGGK